jgi:DNA-binding HxlR family transcriptional regulator
MLLLLWLVRGLGKRPLSYIVPTNEMRVSPIPVGNEVSEAQPATMPPVDDSGAAETEGQVCEHFQRAAETLARRWNPQVIRVLLYGPARFGELRERVPGISDNLLSERLKQLEAEGIVLRTVQGGRPVLIEYSLTESGSALGKVIDALGEWAERYAGVEAPA